MTAALSSALVFAHIIPAHTQASHIIHGVSMFLWAIGYKGGVDWQKPRIPWTAEQREAENERRRKHGIPLLAPRVSNEQLANELSEMKALLKDHMNTQRPQLPRRDE